MSNPLFKRLTRRYPAESLNITLLEIIVAMMIGFLLIVIEGGNFQYIWSGPQDIFLIGTIWAAILLAPLIITAIAAELTAHDVNTDLYKEMCLTSIGNSTIVWGYYLTTLSRLRIILIGVACTLLPLVIAALVRGRFLAGIDCTGNSDLFQPCSNPQVLSYGEQIAWVTLFVELGLGLWGINLLAGAIGVGVGLCIRKRMLSLFAAGMITILMLLVFFYLIISQLGDASYIVDLNNMWHRLSITTFISILPYLAGILILFGAKRWAR
jgi:hypothetical protein